MTGIVTLLGTVEEQRAAGRIEIIEPEGVFVEAKSGYVPVHPNRGFERLGWASRVKVKDGRLVAEIELPGRQLGAFGVSLIMKRRRWDGDQCIVERAALLRVMESDA